MSNNQANVIKNEESNEARKAYVRPQLIKHGEVEKLTQWKIYGNPSQTSW